MKTILRSIDEIAIVTDYVANGSFASLKNEVTYLDSPGYAILVRFTDYTNKWNGKYKYVSKSAYEFLSKSKVFPGDLVIANVGDPGKLFLVPDLKMPMTLGPNSILVRPKVEGVSTYYLSKYLSSPLGQSLIKKIISTTAQSKFNKTSFRKISISLPENYDDQIRVAIVLTRAEKLIAKRKESIKALDELLKSTFLEMFGDPVRNEKGWERIPLSEVLLKIESGRSPVCLDRPAISGEWGVLKLGAVTKCVFNHKENKALPDEEKPNKAIEIKKGDILFSRKNTYELVAACAYVWETPPKLMMSDLIFRLVPRDKNLINSVFLQALLSFSSKRKMIQRLAGGAAGSMPNISKDKLFQHRIEVPPFPLQNQFAAIAEKVEVLKARYTQSLAELENLYGSLSQRAFKGELDLSKVPVVYETETEVGEINMTGSVDIELKTKLEFTDTHLVELIKKYSGKIFSFDELWKDIETLTDKKIPSRKDIQIQIIKLLESDKANFQQVFDVLTSQADKYDVEKQIAFRANYEN